MAGKAITFPLARVSKRGYAQAAAQASHSSSGAPDLKCIVMPNKFMVSSLEASGPLSRVTIAFKCGPRNECNKNLGTSHIIRSMAGFATEKYSWLAIVRNMQQNGIHFTCTGDREVTAFNIVGARNKINCGLKYLGAAVTSPCFKPWQVKDNFERVRYEVKSLPPQAILLENLHKVCFRKGLGNSLFVQEDFIGIHTPEMLKDFVREGFTANRGALVAYNINHRDLLEFANFLDLVNYEPPQGSAKFYGGGEIRKHTNSHFAHIAVATQGVGLKDVKESLVYTVLKHAYGASPCIRWGGSPSPLFRATHPVAPDAGVSCLNISYSDSGLFGVAISGSAKMAGKAVEAAVKVLKSASVSPSDVNRGKALVKRKLLTSSENTANMVEDMAVQSLNGGTVIPGPVLAEAVDKITHADVMDAAKKVASRKLSLSAIGDLREIPYLDELC